jgi:surfeit locus 1 family protein
MRALPGAFRIDNEYTAFGENRLMTQQNFRVRAVVSSVLVTALIVLFVRLGYWQLDRARQKHAAYELSQTNAAREPVSFAEIVNEDPQTHLWRRVTADGQYVARQDVILDNQSFNGRPGYLVFTPFKLSNPGTDVVLVNRGWLVNDGHRETVIAPPAPSGDIRIEARVAKAPTPGLLIAGGDSIELMPNGIRRVQRMDYTLLGKALNTSLFPGVLLLESDDKDGLVHDWHPPGSDEARHQSYAFQWFAMALALAVVYGFALRRWRQ